MAKKSTHLLEGSGSEPGKAIESSSSAEEKKLVRRDWDVRSGYAYNH